MAETISKGDSAILLFMAALVAAWGIAGAVDVPHRTEAGLATDSKHAVCPLRKNRQALFSLVGSSAGVESKLASSD